MKRFAPLLAVALAVVVALFAPFFEDEARALDRNFAGSGQVDYHFVPTEHGASSRGTAFDGFTTEVALKLAVDVNPHLSANVKVCFGCHGFETGMAYFDYRFVDEINVRVGRFSPSFGSFNLRHDPANHRLSDKPLPYDMGRMLRMRDWNQGVLPSPFPDNGLEVNGTHWFGDSVQLDYAAYAVSGFKGDATSTDLDFVQSRSGNLYYVDNHSRPTFGGRTALTLKLTSSADLTGGASVMQGTFDPDNRLAYAIMGADLALRFDRTWIRAEYLVRRQELDTSDPTRFRYEVPNANGRFSAKHGAYVEVEQKLTSYVDLVARADGLFRAGNVLVASAIDSHASVGRLTLGTSVSVDRDLRLKTSVELWRFSDADDRGHKSEVSMHVGAVGTF